MVRLREISRTAVFAWSPGPSKPLLVTGTRAGAVDADFSDETKLELWDLSLDSQDHGLELQPVASITTDSRFYDIVWGRADEDHPWGIIAGALESGSLDLWDAKKLMSGASDSHMSRTTKHTGAIKSLQFNPQKPHILATAGAKGELYIYDVNDISNPFRLGSPGARSDDLECVAWNRKVSHILATGGSGGFVTVWDLKTKKASLTLNNNRKAVSAIAWDPNNSTKLLTATPDDNTPVILLWDLRNSNAPERTLQGHEQGVLSLSWCQQDSDLLLSCGKDNRTLLWNPQTGEQYGEFPEVTNWTFLTRFNPYNPNLSATAGFDGKITVQTLQNTNQSTTQAAAQSNLDGEDFFTSAQTQPQGASFTLTKAPKWLERPIGASFGFGGKLVVVKQSATASNQRRGSKVQISHFSVDEGVGSATQKFEDALKSGDLSSICERRKQESATEEERADWIVIETLVGDNARERIVDYLGFTQDGAANGDTSPAAETKEDSDKNAKEAPGQRKASRLSNAFSNGGEDDGEGDDFLSSLAAAKGAKTDSPFHILSDSDTAVEKEISKAVMLGNFSRATEICLKEQRMADAFLIANCGGQELVEKVQAAYLSMKQGFPSYLRVLGSVITKNLWDVVHNADLENWREAMAILCTFSTPDEFPDLCEALGDRISEQESRQNASFCYLVGSKLEKIVSIWIAQLEEAELADMSKSKEDSTFSVHARNLQYFIEKVSIFRHVTKFEDTEKSLSSGWRLAALYDKYTEYADIVAAHGYLDVAQKYLDLLPNDYPAADISRNRVRQAKMKAASQQSGRQPGVINQRSSSRTQQAMGYQPPQAAPAASPVNPYAAPTQPSANPYGPSSTTPYAPQGYQPPAPQSGYPAPAGYGPPPTSFGTVPRNPTPSGPPPPKASKMDNWNDVPLVARAPPPRRTTPSMAPITSPFPNQQPNLSAPPPANPYGQRTGATPPPPPPKGSAPPRVSSPLTGPPQSLGQAPRPPSTAANAYAPPPPQPGAAPAAMPQAGGRVASPYNAPPTGAPPSSRYAPAPTSQPLGPQPPPGARPPPSNLYGAAPPQGGLPGGPPQSQYAPSPYQVPPAAQGPRPPAGPPPSSGPPPSARARPTPPPTRTSAPPKTKLPPGDRSQIPAAAQGLVEILTRDMQRVAAKAPADYADRVNDTKKRLGLLFDHINNRELVQPGTVEQLSQLAEALDARNYELAQKIQVDIQREKTEECGNWMPGIKRLITMSKHTP